MGETYMPAMVTRAIFTLGLLAVAALALPEDTIVPESTVAETGASATFDEAKAKVDSMLQQGGNLDECKSLGQTTIEEITNAVQTHQDLLEGLDDGETCKDKGQQAVYEATQAKEEA